ncbi:dolichyl-phosphate-mannose-protein mannosyltransferase [Pacificibacter maritimus]|uniref:Dolichyl-phosphate-mannose-protein mannosyltransferase n=1 Tax=Pacificibacter maritimus TaxID=762213 RepID=A0A3N4V0R0_9RHOB|nr:glycosyltransferase family 39 protein [Pacificibacter maritimus]RPE67430.1 dolichyl-phosphate-mannose-protein mannosyltransferase [Pacificibacter maritimus]
MLFSTRYIALGFLILHLSLAAALPLIDDEAYYTLWARWPAAGYYDHPPMIAYFIHLGAQIFGENSFGIRIIGLLGIACSSLLVGDTAQRLGLGQRHAALAVMLFNIGFLPLAIGSFATPDSPSTLFWIAGLWAAIAAVQSQAAPAKTCLTWWLAAGLLIGLGGASKFTNVFLGFGLLGWLVSTREGRAWLRRPYPYFAVCAAILPLIPYVNWNIQNDWLGFERQGSRLNAGGFDFGDFTGYIAALLILPTPLVGWFALRGVGIGKAPQMSLLLWSLAPVLVYFAFHATHDTVQANWLTPIQGAIAILASVALASLTHQRFWTRITVVSGTGLSVILLGALLNPWVPLSTDDTPPNQGRGWKAAQVEIQNLIDDTGAQWIATTDYARTGMLAYQFPSLPVYALTDPQRYGFRPAFDPALCDAPAVLIEKADGNSSKSTQLQTPSAIAEQMFETSRPLQLVQRAQGDKTLMLYQATAAQGLVALGC